MAGLLKRLVPKRFRNDGLVIPVVRLHGAIMSGGGRFKQQLNLATVAPALEKAFSKKESPAVVLSINSPGGSPVQSRLIFDRIRALAEEKNKTRAGLRRGCGGFGRLHDRARRRRDLRRCLLDRRLDRRGFGVVRFP